jgi:hypothetical protein
MKALTPCHCAAYPFPHRGNGGRCDNPGPAPLDCASCEFGASMRDPFATGDRYYVEIECNSPDGCPWGMNE